MVDKRELTMVDEMGARVNHGIPLTHISKLKDPNTMGMQRAVKNSLSYLILDVEPNLMHEVRLLGRGELLIGDGDRTVFMLPLNCPGDVYCPPRLAERAAVFDEHPWWGVSEGIDGKVCHGSGVSLVLCLVRRRTGLGRSILSGIGGRQRGGE